MLKWIRVRLWIWKVRIRSMFKSKKKKELEQKEQDVIDILISRQSIEDYYTMDSILDAMTDTSYDDEYEITMH